MQPTGTDTLLSLLRLAVEAMRQHAEAVTRLEMIIARWSAEDAARHIEGASRHAELLAKIVPAEKSSPSTGISVEGLAKLATNLTTIGAALAKAWGPALVVFATAYKLVWPWVRSLLGLG